VREFYQLEKMWQLSPADIESEQST
jgi:ribosomal silencing factor RsfS